jgi:hypothetical protein
MGISSVVANLRAAQYAEALRMALSGAASKSGADIEVGDIIGPLGHHRSGEPSRQAATCRAHSLETK